MTDTKQEKNVLVIGNGFDLYHCLPTRYIDFINVVNRLKNAIRFTVILCVMSN